MTKGLASMIFPRVAVEDEDRVLRGLEEPPIAKLGHPHGLFLDDCGSHGATPLAREIWMRVILCFIHPRREAGPLGYAILLSEERQGCSKGDRSQ